MPQHPPKVSQSQDPVEFDAEDQSWFWTPEWQAGEKAASREIEDGDISPPFHDIEDAAEWLNSSE